MRKLEALFSVVAVLLALQSTSSADRDSSARPYTQALPIVAVPSRASAAHKALAKKIAESLGTSEILEQPVNPVCCIWVEINGFNPNPGKAGYVIINDYGGSIISAANLEQLRAAVERFRKSVRRRDGKVEVPIGLLTNYPVLPAD